MWSMAKNHLYKGLKLDEDHTANMTLISLVNYIPRSCVGLMKMPLSMVLISPLWFVSRLFMTGDRLFMTGS